MAEPVLPHMEETLTMEPEPLSIIAGAKSLHMTNTALRFTFMSLSQSSRDMSCIWAGRHIPALFTMTSGRPACSMTPPQKLCTFSGSEKSMANMYAFLPIARTAIAVSSAPAMFPEQCTTISYPSLASSRAQALPMPLLAPVIRASIIFLFLCFLKSLEYELELFSELVVILVEFVEEIRKSLPVGVVRDHYVRIIRILSALGRLYLASSYGVRSFMSRDYRVLIKRAEATSTFSLFRHEYLMFYELF